MRLNYEQLTARLTASWKLLEHCCLCPRKCGINRIQGDMGFCRTGREAMVCSYGAHFGEESPLVGRNGSGAIFFCGCNLGCLFCQNHEISQIEIRHGAEVNNVEAKELAAIMFDLQARGCANINLVTPSHLIPQIISALQLAFELGLNIPVVYNSGGYDSVESLRLLDGIVDIYMPDSKFILADSSKKYLQAADYPEVMCRAVTEMHRQVGDLVIDDNGIAKQGLLVRHLVMPGFFEESRAIMRFLAEKISKDTFVNIMDQYHPCHRAVNDPKLNRTLSPGEYERVIKAARELGLYRFNTVDFEKLLAMI